MSIPDLAIDDIEESPTNPRRRFHAMEELADSIRNHGLLQPVIVRPHPSPNPKDFPYELVVGARRLRASKAAGLTAIPGVVSELSDHEVLELQVIENEQREDVHPVEQAEGYQQLHERFGYSIPEIAAKVSKSESTIRSRLKLLELAPKLREACYDGELSASVGLLLARIPDEKLQAKAWKQVQGRSYRSAREYVEREIMRDLKHAPWKLDDAELVPDAGPCTTCPKRSGNQAALFGVTDEPEKHCLDGACFAKKEKATIRAAKRDGRKMIIPKGYERPKGLQSLQDRDYRDTKSRSHKQLCGKHLDPQDIVLVKDRWSGAWEEWAPEPAIAAAKKANGWKAPRKASGTGNSRQTSAAESPSQRKRKLLERVNREADQIALERFRELPRKIQTFGSELCPTLVPGPVLNALALVLLEGMDFWSDEDAWNALLVRREMKPTSKLQKGHSASQHVYKQLGDYLARSEPVETLELLVEAMLIEGASQGGYPRSFMGRSVKPDQPDPIMAQLLECYGLKIWEIRKTHQAAVGDYLRALPKPSRKKAPSQKKKATATKKAARKKTTKKKASQSKASTTKRAAARKPAE